MGFTFRLRLYQAVQSGQETTDKSTSTSTQSKASSTRIGESRRHSQPPIERKDSDQEIDILADTADHSSSSLLGIDTGRLPAAPSEIDFSFLTTEEVSNVYEEDILPLRQFLDQNSPDAQKDSVDEQTAIDLVKIYIGTVVKEGRLGDAVAILRSIRKRRDHWSTSSILEQIVEECSKAYDMDDHIGVDWLEC